MNAAVKHFLIWIAVVVSLLVVWKFVAINASDTADKSLSMSEMLSDADAGKISSITMDGTTVMGNYKDGKETFHTNIPVNYPVFYERMRADNVTVNVKNPEGSAWLNALMQLLPLVVPAIVISAFEALLVILFWRILSRAGPAGPLAFLALVPLLGSLILLCILAFGEWKTAPAPASQPPVHV